MNHRLSGLHGRNGAHVTDRVVMDSRPECERVKVELLVPEIVMRITGKKLKSVTKRSVQHGHLGHHGQDAMSRVATENRFVCVIAMARKSAVVHVRHVRQLRHNRAVDSHVPGGLNGTHGHLAHKHVGRVNRLG